MIDMGKIYVFLAEGFEEIEAVTPIDVLRRAGGDVVTVGVTGLSPVGGHGITMKADMDGVGFTLPPDAAMVVLPGGGGGTENLLKSGMVAGVLADAATRGIFIAAICAAPKVLHRAGLLAGKTVTSFPSVAGELAGATHTGAAVEVDGNIITGRSAGVALQFSHELASLLFGREKADATVAALYPA